MRRSLIALSLALVLAKAVAAVPVKRCVYMFGFAASFTDSVAYITDVQAIDTAYVYKNGFIADRSLYTIQLSDYLLTELDMDNMTCALFYDTKKSRLEKKYLKVRKKYTAAHTTVLTPLGKDAFAFKGEEWINSTATDAPVADMAEEVRNEMPPEAGIPPAGDGRR